MAFSKSWLNVVGDQLVAKLDSSSLALSFVDGAHLAAFIIVQNR